MVKQKVVIKVSLSCEKARKKALSIAVDIDGVAKAELAIDKDEIVVTGNDMDVVLLGNKLRMTLKHAVVETVSIIVDEKKDEKKDEKEAEYFVPYYPQNNPPIAYFYGSQIPEPCYNYASPSCSIL